MNHQIEDKERQLKEIVRRAQEEEARVVKERKSLEHRRKEDEESVTSVSMTRERMDLALGYSRDDT